MTILLEHKNLRHKDQDYTQTIINTSKDFDNWYQDVSHKNLIFRGQSYAKYKNYSSSQRKWMQDPDLIDKFGDGTDVYVDYILSLISKCRDWESGIVENYLGKGREPVSDLMFLSIMQHYGAPTPLIDFTYDINVALNFACEDNKRNERTGDIDDYMSIYSIDIEENSQRIIKLSDKPELKSKPYKELVKLEQLILIDDRDILHSNLNIIAQKGLFLLNYHPWKYLGGWSNKHKIFDDIFVETDLPQLPLSIPVLYKMDCADIHKDLITYIKSKYLNNLRNLFPKYKDMVNYIER